MSARTRLSSAVLAALVVFAESPAAAQSIPKMLGNDLRNVAGDAWDVWTSPLRGQPRDWLTAAALLGLSAAVSPLDDNVDRWAFNHGKDNAFDVLSPFRAGGEAFSGKYVTPVALGVLVVSLAAKNETVQEGLFGCVTAYGASSLVRSFVVYPLVERTRPNPRPPNGPPPPAGHGDQYEFGFPGTSDWGGHSLPGGHVANVVACASFLTQRYSMGIAEPAIWALAGGIGLGRVLDRAHWTSDQLLGVGFGYAVGRQVALRSKRRNEKRLERAGDSGGFQAFVTPGSEGFRVGWTRVF